MPPGAREAWLYRDVSWQPMLLRSKAGEHVHRTCPKSNLTSRFGEHAPLESKNRNLLPAAHSPISPVEKENRNEHGKRRARGRQGPSPRDVGSTNRSSRYD